MADYKVPSKLRKTEVDPAACESCHTLSEVATKTADLSLLTDDNGKTVNPHDMPETEQHENVTCASCHDMHSSSSPVDDAPAVACTSALPATRSTVTGSLLDVRLTWAAVLF